MSANLIKLLIYFTYIQLALWCMHNFAVSGNNSLGFFPSSQNFLQEADWQFAPGTHLFRKMLIAACVQQAGNSRNIKVNFYVNNGIVCKYCLIFLFFSG